VNGDERLARIEHRVEDLYDRVANHLPHELDVVRADVRQVRGWLWTGLGGVAMTVGGLVAALAKLYAG
jgi:hypothetical protein